MSDEIISQNAAPDTVDIEIINDIYHVFANGHKVEIGANTSDSNKTTITATGATFNYNTQDNNVVTNSNVATFSEVASKKLVVFGGSKNASVDSSDITMTGGKVLYLVGGGYFALEKSGSNYAIPTNAVRADVKSSTIKMTGGKASSVFGGGMGFTTVGNSTISISGNSIAMAVSGGGFNGHLTGLTTNGSLKNCEYGIIADETKLIDKFYNTLTGTVNVTISDANVTYAEGGGELGCTYVNESNLIIKSGTSFDEIIAGGTNGYTKKVTLTIDADDSKTIKTGLISSGNRGQVAEAIIYINDLGQDGKADLIAVGALSGLTATDGGPNAIFDIINFNISEDSKGTFSNIYLGGAKWSKGVNSWEPDRHNSLSDTNITINAPDRTIIAADIPADASFITDYSGYASQAVAVDYTIATGKTWTLTSGTLEVKDGSSITNNGTFSNNGTIVVNDYQSLVNAAKAGGNIQLGTNITSDAASIIFDKKATLDLNGQTLTLNGAAVIKVSAGGDLTIRDTSDSIGKIDYTVASDEDSAIKVVGTDGNNTANLTLEKCEIVVNDSNNFKGYGVLAAMYSKITSGIESGNNNDVKISAGYSAISGNGTYLGTNLTINSGTYESKESAAIYFPCNGSLTVNGGVFKGKSGFDIRAGNISISNATITTHGKYTDIADNSNPLRADLPAVWGIGIAVFDHNSYSSGETITLNIDNVTFACENSCNIFVGKHPANAGSSYNGKFSDARIALNHIINITINDVDFETKGLYINGANNVKITDCDFTNISESPIPTTNPNLYSNAIYLLNCTGDITIGGNAEADGNTISANNPKPMRGIFIDNCGTSGKTLSIQNNTISDVNFNALQLTALKFTTIDIENNIISNWDADNDGVAEQSNGYAGGRAIRMTFSSDATAVTIENNVFSRSYANNASFVSDLGITGKTGYDDGNVLKMNASSITTLTVKNNYLNLTNVKSADWYNNSNIFNIESLPTGYYLSVFDSNGGSIDSKGSVLSSIINDAVSAPSNPTKSSNTFDGWYNAATGGEKWTPAQTAISADTVLYAHWTYNGSSGGGIPITPPTVDPEPEPIIPDTNGNVTVPALDEKKTEELIHEAVSSGSDSITIIDTSDVKGDYTAVTVSKSDLETIAKSIENNKNIDSVSIPTSEGNIIIEKEVLSSILENTDAESVSFEVEDAKNKLTEEQKKAVGDRPVYDISIKAGNENVTSFNGKTITISLPYTLKAGEDPKNIVVYYVKDDGSLEKMNCEYKDGKVTFETNHLSKYVIGYEESDKPVTPDTPDDEKKESSNNTIYYAVAAVIIILIIIALAYYFMKKKQ